MVGCEPRLNLAGTKMMASTAGSKFPGWRLGSAGGLAGRGVAEVLELARTARLGSEVLDPDVVVGSDVVVEPIAVTTNTRPPSPSLSTDRLGRHLRFAGRSNEAIE